MRLPAYKAVINNGLWHFVAATALVLGGVGSASAARIHYFSVPKPPPTTHLSFTRFLAAGPSLWARARPRIPHGLQLSHNADGTLVDNSFLDFLLYRRGLNPACFDAHHRNIGPILAGFLPGLPAVSTPVPLVSAPQIVGPPPRIPPQGQQVPEPSTWVIGAILIAGTAFARSRGKRSAGWRGWSSAGNVDVCENLPPQV